MKFAKYQANAKQQPEAELLLFENYSHFSSTLSSENNKTSQPAPTCPKLTIENLEQGVKYVQSWQ